MLQEIENYAIKARNDTNRITLAEDAETIKDAWQNFLTHFSRALGKLIAISLLKKQSKSWGHRLKNESTKNDKGLVFLREARNHVEHGLGPFAEFQERHVHVPGFGALWGNSRMENCYISNEDQNAIIEELEVKQGKLEKFFGSSTAPIRCNPPRIVLKAITSSEKKKVFQVPDSIGGVSLVGRMPDDLAKLAVNMLDTWIAEYKHLVNLP